MIDEAHRLGAEWLAEFLDHYGLSVEWSDRVVETMERWRVTPMDLRHVLRNPTSIVLERQEGGGAVCSVEGIDLDGRRVMFEAEFSSQEMTCQVRKVIVPEVT